MNVSDSLVSEFTLEDVCSQESQLWLLYVAAREFCSAGPHLYSGPQ